MGIRIYTYKNCGTCRKALKFLDANGLDYEKRPIRETPPAKTELKQVLKCLDGEIRRLFNTSGGDYRAMNLKEKLPQMTQAEAIDLLASNGNLVKRPFLIVGRIGAVGFNEAEWKRLLL